MKVKHNNDGTVECIFPHLKPGSKKITQRFAINKCVDTDTGDIQLIEEKPIDALKGDITYISYHTTGQVNYHRMSFESNFLEPLYDVKQANPFFILSFEEMCNFKEAMADEIQSSHGIEYDLSSFGEARVNVIFSIIPCSDEISSQFANTLSVNYDPMYRLMIQFVNDTDTFGFSKLYDPGDCVRLRIHNDLFSELPTSRGQALINYVKKLYQTDEIVLTAPNGEGVLNLYFTVEMRRRPFVKIDFANKDYCVEITSKEAYRLKFKVFDNKRKCYVKKAEEIQISEIILDAEIYDDEINPPAGFM